MLNIVIVIFHKRYKHFTIFTIHDPRFIRINITFINPNTCKTTIAFVI